MNNAMALRASLCVGVSIIAVTFSTGALAQDAASGGQSSSNAVDTIIVTAQKKEEALQDVPIAVSAFTQQSLEKQKIDGGPQLVQSVPNVSFSKSFYTGFNFSIRGVGTKLLATAGDSGTGVHINNAPLTVSRLFEAEFFDVERVEVLRGPQGTLYGRNATGGVVNVLTAKPKGIFEAKIKAEVGNYDTRRLQGMVNLPIVGDKLDLRVAGAYQKRSGFGDNVLTGNDIDGRDLWSIRTTLAFNPTDNFKTYLMWQHFEEDDDRARSGKTLCATDPGKSSVGGVAITNPLLKGFTSQGCLAAPINSPAAQGAVNTLATLGGILGLRSGLLSGNANAGVVQPNGPRDISALHDPTYYAKEDVFVFNATWDISDALQLSSLTSYSKSYVNSTQDYFKTTPSATFNVTAQSPGGVFNDPQVGSYNRFVEEDISRGDYKQWSQEFRLQSNLDGPVNFNLGAFYLDYKALQNYYVYANTWTSYVNVLNGLTPCAAGGTCFYVDPNKDPNTQGHNYFLSRQPYRLKSSAAFGEVYWQASDTFKVTGGLRYTVDKKALDNVPARLLTPGSGLIVGTPAVYRSEFKEFTGRLGFDWKPKLDFTDETLIYAFYSRGYKGGGPNNVTATGTIRQIFDPEFVNAYEVGTKNTLLDGAMQLNLTGFYYDYKGYQLAKIVNRVSVTENVDARNWGLEAEAIWQPVRGLKLNATAGYLNTKIQGGTSLDVMDRTQGDASLTFLKNSSAGACVVPTAALANLIGIIQQNPGSPVIAGTSGNPLALLNACSGAYASLGVTPTEGVPVNLKGKHLPNAPALTANLGAEYNWTLSGDWAAMVRGDVYRQSKSYSRIYNTAVDKLPAWTNVNFSVQLINDAHDVTIEAYVKNAFDKSPVTDTFVLDDSNGLGQVSYVLDPRTYGVSISKRF